MVNISSKKEWGGIGVLSEYGLDYGETIGKFHGQ